MKSIELRHNCFNTRGWSQGRYISEPKPLNMFFLIYLFRFRFPICYYFSFVSAFIYLYSYSFLLLAYYQSYFDKDFIFVIHFVCPIFHVAFPSLSKMFSFFYLDILPLHLLSFRLFFFWKSFLHLFKYSIFFPSFHFIILISVLSKNNFSILLFF